MEGTLLHAEGATNIYAAVYEQAKTEVAAVAARDDYVRASAVLDRLPVASQGFRAEVTLEATEVAWPQQLRVGADAGRYLLFTGWLLESTGRSDSAMMHFTDASLLFDELGREDLLAWANYGQEYLISVLPGYEDRGVLLDQVLATAQAAGMSELEAMAYSLRAFQLMDDQPEKALRYYRQALDIQRQRADWEAVLREYVNVVNALYFSEQLDEAKRYLEEALSLYEAKGLDQPRQLARIHLELARMKIEEGMAPSARVHIDRAHRALETRGTAIDMSTWTAMAVMYFEKTQQYDSALTYLHLLNNWNGRVDSLEAAEVMAGHIYRYRTLDAEADRARAELAAATLTNQRNLILSGLILTAIGLIAAFGVLAQRRKANRLEVENLRLQQANELDRLEREKQLAVTQSLLDGQARERHRIAHELHDGLGGRLAGLRWKCGELREDLGRQPDNEASINGIYEGLTIAYHHVRDLSHALNYSDLREHGLVHSLQQLADRLGRSKGLQVTLRSEGKAIRLPHAHEIHLFLAISELCTNVLKHARATSLEIELSWLPEELSVMVVDNGRGFRPEGAAGGIGIRGIRERMQQLNADLVIDSGRGAGTTVMLDVPIRRSDAESTGLPAR